MTMVNRRWSLAVLRLVLAFALAATALTAVMGLVPPGGPPAAADPLTTLPPDFQDVLAIGNLDTPTTIRFSPDGRVFVTEKMGKIKVFDSLSSDSPSLTIDIQDQVNSYWDHGLSGLAVDPQFPTSPYIYVTYTRDAPLGVAAPYWHDECPGSTQSAPGRCATSGRLSRFRLTLAPGQPPTAGAEEALITDWCQQFVTHSIDDVVFGPDGKLYISAGEGASHASPDYGQFEDESATYPCGDPPDEGGALRAQDIRTGGDLLGYSGSILRVDPNNPTNPQIVGYGVRNPYRMAFRPGTTGELWLGDVGTDQWEELNRIPNALGGAAPNFGWPCYEGGERMPGFDALDLPLCEELYAPTGGTAPATMPSFAYRHSERVVAGDGCRMDPVPPMVSNSSVTGVAFYNSAVYPAQYQGALFFADFARGCIWAMAKNQDGSPNPASSSPFVAGDIWPVDLQTGPNGDLFYADIWAGTVRRITYRGPVAAIVADRTNGAAPLTVHLNGRGSTAPSGQSLSFSWDLNGDGTFGDSTSPELDSPPYAVGEYTVRLRVTATNGATNVTSVRISAGNTPPTASITTPTPALRWQVGQAITFSGTGSDPQQGTLPASALTWTLILHHGAHQHLLQTFTGRQGGSFDAPDHEYPSWLELRLTVRDSGNLTDTTSVRLDPQTVTLSLATSPAGGRLVLNYAEQQTPSTQTVIRGSQNIISAIAPSGTVLTGWAVNGQAAGWAPGLPVLADADKAVSATFGAVPQYGDVPTSHPAYQAVSQLGARGLVRGYGDGRFGPGDRLLRAQAAALLVRAMGWSGERHANPFADGGGIAPELWSSVATLAARGIARGYDADTYGPNDPVSQAQAISFITRTMVAQGYWRQQPDNPALYPAVPASAGHRTDIATFVHYAGSLPDTPAGSTFAAWNQPATRGWFARALWQALDSHFGR